MSIPTGLLPIKRLSPFVFDWSYADLSLTARTGQAGVYNRASSATVVDQNGVTISMANNAPRFTTGGLLLEPASTNLVTFSDTLGGAPWAAAGTLGITSNYVTLNGVSYARVTNMAGAGQSAYFSPVPFTGNATKSFAFRVRSDGVAGNFSGFLYDGTASASRCTFLVTVASNGVVTASCSVGSLLRVVSLSDGSYRLLFQAPGIIAANTNTLYINNGTIGSTTITSVQVSRVQAEDALVPSSEIPTAGSTVTRAVDSLSFPFKASPGASTWYTKFVEQGTILSPSNAGLFCIGDAGVGSFFVYNSGSGAYRVVNRQAADVQGIAASAPVLGDTVEIRAVLNADGTVLLGQSINGAAETVTATSAANALPSAWGTTTLRLNDLNGALPGWNMLQAFRIAQGFKTLDQIRQVAP